MNIHVEPVENNENNGRLIMEWRNNEYTGEMSYNSELKEWDKFKNIYIYF